MPRYTAHAGGGVLVDDEQVRGERHQFPAEQKCIDAVGEQDQQHRCQEDIRDSCQAGPAMLVVCPRVRQSSQRDGQRDSGQQQHEPGA
jgi:hypothetical protein